LTFQESSTQTPITLTPKFHEEIASTPFLMNSMCSSAETGFAAQLWCPEKTISSDLWAWIDILALVLTDSITESFVIFLSTPGSVIAST